MSNTMMFNLQDASSFLMEQLIFFHDHSLFFLLFVLSLVSYLIVSLIMSKLVNLFLLFNESVEIIWTLFPGIILGFIALPSLKVLYLADEVLDPALTVKVVGHQWNWSYEYSDFEGVEFNSFMLPNKKGGEHFRLLEVDNRLIIPMMMKIRVVLTSSDVIHSWSIPSLGVKMDANPGRLNQIIMQSNRIGLFYGQCSEICGTLHSFMPICVEVVNVESFFSWLKKYY